MSNIHHLERSLRKLRLTRVGAEWHALEKRALAEGWTPSRYLLTLCNEELLWRESEKLRRYKKEARLPVAYYHHVARHLTLMKIGFAGYHRTVFKLTLLISFGQRGLHFSH